MSNLTAYRCIECGHYTVSKHDGIRCAECKGYVVPVGHATYRDKSTALTVDVSLKDTGIFKRMLRVFSALMDDKHTPDWIKSKIKSLFLDELNKD
jgi:hypothetical protein